MAAGMMSCADPATKLIAAAGSDATANIHHANKVITRMKREARHLRMKKGRGMGDKLILAAGAAQQLVGHSALAAGRVKPNPAAAFRPAVRAD